MRCYQEPFREHIGNKQKTTTSPAKPKRKKLSPTEPSHWLDEICVSKTVRYHFHPEHKYISIILCRTISQHCLSPLLVASNSNLCTDS
jgi:hypothetical protein